MPCCMIATPDRGHFGRITADRSIADIWNGRDYEQFRRALATDDPPDICRSCSVYRGTF